MSEYVAVWAEVEKPDEFYAGRVAVEGGCVQLHGRGSRGSFARAIEQDEIASVQRTRGALERRGGRPWVRLDLRSGGGLLVTTVLGAATLAELLDVLQGFLGG